MSNHFTTAGVIAFVYIIVKFLEMRFITKEIKPVKETTRDTIMVYITSVLSLFIIQHIDETDIAKSNGSAGVFVGEPEF